MTSDNSVAIDLADVFKAYGAKIALDGLTLQVYHGEVFAFLGPNGAGKTTTIKLIAGLLRADAGKVEVCGQPMASNGSPARARISYVPDQPFVYEKLTGRELLSFVRQMYRVPLHQAQPRLEKLQRQLAMDEFLDGLCEGYSHGMKQKVVLASALLVDPEVLVVDEPMVGLDPATVRVVKDLFLERARLGRTVFMSTHTLAVAESVADRIGIIHKGRLITVGSVAQLRSQAHEKQSLEEIFLELTAEEDPDRTETVS